MRGKCVAFVLVLILGVSTATGTVISNGTGGGNWSTGSTWVGNNPPTNADFTVAGTDTVTTNSITLAGANQSPNIFGTLAIDSGSSFTGINRINSASTTAGGVLNIDDSSVTAAQIRPGVGGTFGVNISDGGLLSLSGGVQGTPSVVTIDVNPGGTYVTTGNGGETINLEGGTTYSNIAGGFVVPTNWTSGTVITNTASISSTYATQFAAAMNSHSSDVLQLSNASTAQTLTWSNTSSFKPTSGVVLMKVYSTTANDLMTYTSSGSAYTISSGVQLLIESGGDLPGTAADYLNKTYQLFNNGNYATDLNPTIGAVSWDIGGTEYNVTFADSINTNGSVTVSSLTAVPEPACLALLGASGLLALRRRHRAVCAFVGGD